MIAADAGVPFAMLRSLHKKKSKKKRGSFVRPESGTDHGVTTNTHHKICTLVMRVYDQREVAPRVLPCCAADFTCISIGTRGVHRTALTAEARRSSVSSILIFMPKS